jgi:6-phosphogluconolactonase/glucosamine-6-phosphate isomerase/deaminase
METKASSQTKARLIVVTVFVIGFAAGALSLNLYEQMTSSSKKTGPHNGTEFLIKRMDERVGLTTDQQDQIKKILDETNEKYREIRGELEPRIKDFEPRFNAVREQSRDRIRALLTPDQLPKYEKMIVERDRMREQEREHNKK